MEFDDFNDNWQVIPAGFNEQTVDELYNPVIETGH